MVFSNLMYKNFNRKVSKYSNSFGKELINQIISSEKNEKIDEKDINRVKRLIKKNVYKKIFDDTIVEYNKNRDKNEAIKGFIKNYEAEIYKMVKNYKRNNELRSSYLVFILGEYRLDREYINKCLINNLNSKSLYTKYNILRSIANIGNNESFIKAINYISATEVYLNNRIFMDIIGDFTGDKNKLNKELLKTLDDFTDEIKIIIIGYFTNVRYDEAKENLLKLFESNYIDKELKATIIRYFTKIHYDNFREILISMLDCEEWEIRAISAKALLNYYSEETVEGLLSSITDSNWYVRFNSAMSLLQFDLGDDLLNKVLRQNDRYAIEILYYAMFERKVINYEEYKIKVSRMEKGLEDVYKEVSIC